jgi:YjbE family integral membrane protein
MIAHPDRVFVVAFPEFCFMEWLDSSIFYALFQVVVIDLVLAGDNAIVIGMAAAGLPKAMRRKAILIGILAATILRIGFALATTQLLALTGLLFAGGILLLWVCWKMWRELAVSHDGCDAEGSACGAEGSGPGTKTLGQAVIQIIIADVSMSLDNVLAVAGAAHDHIVALVFGLVLSVLLMGAASTVVASLLHRYRWIAWLGLLIILFVAVRMIYAGADELMGGVLPSFPLMKDAA